MNASQRHPLTPVLIAVFLGAALPQMLGSWYAVLALAALPLVMAYVSAAEMPLAGLTGALCLLSAVLPGAQAVLPAPAWLLPPLLCWILFNGLYPLLMQKAASMKHVAYMGALCCVTALLACIMAAVRYQGSVTDGLAASLCNLVEGLPLAERVQMLLVSYQSGLSRLDAETGKTMIAAVRLFGALGVSPELQQQLLYSLRTSLEKILPLQLPGLAVQWGLLTTLVFALTGDAVTRSTARLDLTAHRVTPCNGRPDTLPPFGAWYITRSNGHVLMGMILMGLIPYFFAEEALVLTASMCSALGSWCFIIQGMAFLWQKAGSHRGGKTRTVVLLCFILLLFPFLLTILGLYDQHSDPRNLREKQAV